MHLRIVCAGTGDLNPTLDFTLEEPSILTKVPGVSGGHRRSVSRVGVR